MHPTKSRPGGAALFAALLCLGMALFQLYLGLETGGVPPEFLLFVALSAIFALLWYSFRKLQR